MFVANFVRIELFFLLLLKESSFSFERLPEFDLQVMIKVPGKAMNKIRTLLTLHQAEAKRISQILLQNGFGVGFYVQCLPAVRTGSVTGNSNY